MKLNLVPATVKKGAAMRTMVVVSVLGVLLSALATVGMAVVSQQQLDDAKRQAEEARPNADRAVAVAKQVQAVLENSRGVATNLDLASQMTAHNTRYTSFYTKVMPYVPAFMRVTSMRVEPISETSCRLHLTGVIQTAQQYADLSLALMRIPGAKAISRAGFVASNPTVPALNETDQIGRLIPANGVPLPEDPVDRMRAIVARATAETTGFENVGNFGSDLESARGAMNRWSAIGVSVLLEATPGQELPPGWDFNFLVPNPTQTLNAAATFNAAQAASAAQTSAPGAPPGGAPVPGRPVGAADDR